MISLKLSDLKRNWRQDLLSGFLIFLIALPLSLGIALGSNVPPMAGIFSAFMGGVIVSLFCGSNVIIAGPAAGLIVVILHGVETLGNGDAMAGYRLTLAAIVIAGLLQVGLGLFKAGKLASYFPASVVHGMMSAIGIIIMAKQAHTLLGVKPVSKDIFGMIGELPHSFTIMNPDIVIIGAVSLLLLIVIPKLPFPWMKRVPTAMLVVVVGIALDKYFDLEHAHKYLINDQLYELGPKFLVQLPASVAAAVTTPDWSMLGSPTFWFVTVSIALVAALESLLTASAIQGIDPQKRRVNFDRDLVALGAATSLSGLIGGLPMIAEVVRSSSNVSNGAKSMWANLFHGLLLMGFIILLPWLIQEIPLASLAAILLMVGWRLASPKEFIKIYNIGPDQLVVFCTTVVFTLGVDLLVGVGMGIVMKILLHMFRGLSPRMLFKDTVSLEHQGANYTLRIKNAAIFWNLLKIKEFLNTIPVGSTITVDVTTVKMIDHTLMEYFESFRHECDNNGTKFVILGLDRLAAVSSHPLSVRHS